MTILRLAIPSPLRRSFDYLPPAGIDPRTLLPGTRLQVPFGSRRVTAYLLELSERSEVPAEKLRAATAVLDDNSLLPPAIWQLLRWAIDYYQHPPGEVMAAAFPVRLRQGRDSDAAGVPHWQLTLQGQGLPPGALQRAPRQSQVIARLQQGVASHSSLLAEGVSTAVLRQLRGKGLVERVLLGADQDAAGPVAPQPPQLSDEQSAAVEGITEALGDFSCHLLDGITGSGKTEVYLQLIARAQQRGEQVLVLVPEIGLTPQTLRRFEQRFGERIAVMHSGLGDKQRQQAWDATRTGAVDVLLGTRSAIFTPMARPGLIIVDEEHDGAYKQQDGFRYSARDVAIKRAQLESIPVLLGSATPSLETLNNVQLGRYQCWQLTHRAAGASLPRIEAVDLRRQALQGGFAPAVLTAMRETLANGQQVLLFLNRRGFAPSLRCQDCGWIAGCEHCDARLTVHKHKRRLLCHHCDSRYPLYASCPQCSSRELASSGLGTEQVEQFLQQQFADWPIHRVDRDTVSTRQAMTALVSEVARGEPCLLVGTQMLAKGHHFPAVTLVVIVDSDSALFSADFRGEERLAQLLTQVSGRAGRAREPGRVLLQTHYPEHPLVQAITCLPYRDNAHTLLAQRAERGLPPAAHIALLQAESKQEQVALEFLQRMRRENDSGLPLTPLGPLPSPMQRRAGRFRYQLLLISPRRPDLRRALQQLVQWAELQSTPAELRWFLDVDPQDMG